MNDTPTPAPAPSPSPSASAGEPPKPPAQGRPRMARGLVGIASVLLISAILATWVRAQILDTEGWTQTSVQMLQNEKIRDLVSTELSERLLSIVDVQALASEKLPKALAPLAPALSSAAASFVPQAVDKALEVPAVQTLWAEANRRAHARVLEVLNGGGPLLTTSGGAVKINLEVLLNKLGDRLGIGSEIGKKLPPERRQILLLRSKQLDLAQRTVKLLRHLSFILPALVALLYVAALAIATGTRRRILIDIGFGMVGAALVSLVLRRWVGSYVVHEVVHAESVRPAMRELMAIATAGWRSRALLILVTGVVFLFAGWLAGPARLAIGLRGHLAGPLEHHRYVVIGCVVAFVLLVAALGPARTPGQAIPLLIELVLAVVGVLALRRQVIQERSEHLLRS